MNPLQKYLSSIKTPSYSIFNQPTKTTTPSTTLTKPTNVMTQVSNSPAATSPAPATIKPVSSTPTAARSAYASSLSTETGNGGSSQYYAQQNTAPNTTANGMSTSGDTPAAKNGYLNSYRDYLAQYATSLKPTADVQAANQKLASIQSEIDERSFRGRKAEEDAFYEPGMLKSGAMQATDQIRRRNTSELADLAVRESGAARSLSALTGAQTANQNYLKTLTDLSKPIQVGDDYIDPTTGQIVSSKATTADTGFTLSPGETRFDSAGNPVASGGAKPMSAAQEAASIKQQEDATTAEKQATQSLSLINNLLAGDTSKITGIGQNPLNFFGASNAQSINQYNQLQGLLKLGVRGLLKGQGAVSDYEGKVLAQAASSLGRNLPNAPFQQALKDLRGVIKTNNGQITSVTVTNPETGEVITDDLSGAEIYQLVSEGNTVKYN